jgi:hypothetical protein
MFFSSSKFPVRTNLLEYVGTPGRVFSSALLERYSDKFCKARSPTAIPFDVGILPVLGSKHNGQEIQLLLVAVQHFAGESGWCS